MVEIPSVPLNDSILERYSFQDAVGLSIYSKLLGAVPMGVEPTICRKKCWVEGIESAHSVSFRYKHRMADYLKEHPTTQVLYLYV